MWFDRRERLHAPCHSGNVLRPDCQIGNYGVRVLPPDAKAPLAEALRYEPVMWERGKWIILLPALAFAAQASSLATAEYWSGDY
jgi:hypothetical protein